MKFRLLIVSVIFFAFFFACKKDKGLSQSQEFIKYFGSSSSSMGYDLKQTSDGGYIIVGSTLISGADTNVFLVKTDAQGNKQWSNTYGGQNSSTGKSVQLLPGGGYVVLGTTYNGNDYDMYLIKTDANGKSLLGAQNIPALAGKPDNQVGNCVQVTSDGKYFILAGSTDSLVGSNRIRTLLLIKVDVGGNLIWSKPSAVSTLSQYGNCVQLVNDTTMFIIGNQNIAAGSSSYNLWPVVTFYGNNFNEQSSPPSLNGNPIIDPNNSYNGTSGQIVRKSGNVDFIIVGTEGNNIYIGDVFDSIGSLSSSALPYLRKNGLIPGGYTKISNGNGTLTGNSIGLTSDGGYIIGGTINNGGNNDQYLLKTDKAGNKMWDNSFGGSGADDHGEAVIQTSDGGYAIVGYSAIGNNTVMTLIKVTSAGTLQK